MLICYYFSMEVQDENSISRQRRAAQLSAESKSAVLSILGDSADEKYPIYMTGNIHCGLTSQRQLLWTFRYSECLLTERIGWNGRSNIVHSMHCFDWCRWENSFHLAVQPKERRCLLHASDMLNEKLKSHCSRRWVEHLHGAEIFIYHFFETKLRLCLEQHILFSLKCLKTELITCTTTFIVIGRSSSAIYMCLPNHLQQETQFLHYGKRRTIKYYIQQKQLHWIMNTHHPSQLYQLNNNLSFSPTKNITLKFDWKTHQYIPCECKSGKGILELWCLFPILFLW